MQEEIAAGTIIRKPKKWLRMRSVNLSFLETNAEAKLSYAAITHYHKLYMSVIKEGDEYGYNTARQLVKKSDDMMKQFAVDWRKARKDITKQKELMEALLAKLKVTRSAYYDLVKRHNNHLKKEDYPIVLPASLLLIYTLDELEDMGWRLMNRLNSSYLYEDSEDKQLLECVLNAIMPRIWVKYINAYSKDDNAESQSNIMTEIFEYILIIIYKINDGVSLNLFAKLPSITTEVLTEEFNKSALMVS